MGLFSSKRSVGDKVGVACAWGPGREMAGQPGESAAPARMWARPL